MGFKFASFASSVVVLLALPPSYYGFHSHRSSHTTARRRRIPSTTTTTTTPVISASSSSSSSSSSVGDGTTSVKRLTAEAVPAQLMSRIDEYLSVREADAAAATTATTTAERGGETGAAAAGGSAEKNAVFDFLGVDPVSKKRKDELAKLGASGDPLSYGELRRLGFDDLVAPIMALGGYVAVSVALGLEVAPVPVQVEPDWGLSLSGDEEEELGLALGDSLEAALAKAAAVDRAKKAAAEAAEAEAGAEAGAAAGAEWGEDGEGARRRRGGRRSGTAGLPQAPAQYARVKVRPSPEAAAAAAAEAEAKKARAGQAIELKLPQRAWALAVAAVVAVGWGHASEDLLARGWLADPAAFVGAVNGCREASYGLIVANAASTALGVSYALERRRSVPIWLAKLILAGPAALWELRLLEPLAPVGDEGRE